MVFTSETIAMQLEKTTSSDVKSLQFSVSVTQNQIITTKVWELIIGWTFKHVQNMSNNEQTHKSFDLCPKQNMLLGCAQQYVKLVTEKW